MGILCTWSRRFRLDYDDHDASVGDDDDNDNHDGMDSRVDAADGHGGGAGGDYDIDEDVGCVAAASVSNKTSEMQPKTQNTKPKCGGGPVRTWPSMQPAEDPIRVWCFVL